MLKPLLTFNNIICNYLKKINDLCNYGSLHGYMILQYQGKMNHNQIVHNIEMMSLNELHKMISHAHKN